MLYSQLCGVLYKWSGRKRYTKDVLKDTELEMDNLVDIF